MKLVNVSDYGIKSINYYWVKREQFNLSEDELKSVGIIENIVLIDEELIPKLQEANKIFQKHGYEMIVKDGYRSPKQYQLVKNKRYAIEGKENTDKTFNAVCMPHSSGKVVDINLIDIKTGKEVEMWDQKDWLDGVFTDFYRNKTDVRSKEFQKLQDLLVITMLGIGFKLGLKKEFWHFEYGLDF